MPEFTLENIPQKIYDQLVALAHQNDVSVEEQIIMILKANFFENERFENQPN